MTTRYQTTDTHITFIDLDAACEYALGNDELLEVYETVEVCRASADFMALSYTSETQRIGMMDPQDQVIF